MMKETSGAGLRNVINLKMGNEAKFIYDDWML